MHTPGASTNIPGTVELAIAGEFFFGNVELTAKMEAAADEAVIQALTEWSSCMAARGLACEHFSRARIDAEQHPGEADSIATADAMCTEESALGARYNGAYAVALG